MAPTSQPKKEKNSISKNPKHQSISQMISMMAAKERIIIVIRDHYSVANVQNPFIIYYVPTT